MQAEEIHTEGIQAVLVHMSGPTAAVVQDQGGEWRRGASSARGQPAWL